jgi:hypothetical protein
VVATRLEFEPHLAIHFEEDDLGIVFQWQMVLVWQHVMFALVSGNLMLPIDGLIV